MRNFRLAAVGAFVIGGLLLFAVGIFLIGSRRMLFDDTFRVYAEFSQIAALENGAKVRVGGMDAGEVEHIQVPAGPSGRFRVRMRVREALHQIVRRDSVASIQNDGLVGNKFVQIEAGSEAEPPVPDQGTIQSREPFDFATLLTKMSETIDTVNATIVSVKAELDQAIGTIVDTATAAQDLIGQVGETANDILARGQKVTADVQEIVAGVRAGRGTVGRLMTDDALFEEAKRIGSDAEQAMANVRQATEQAKSAIEDLRNRGGDVGSLTSDLKQTLASARDAMADMQETTEALKRNFLVRGFFNRRGYYDLDDLSVEAYRDGALERGERRALRIWIGADVLFEQNARGEEVLSAAGRQRIDLAMSQLIHYPRTSPLIVEGYAREGIGSERFLTSRSRALAVRSYILGKYGLNGNYVAAMPMGETAKDSPAGDTWDGIAIARFVDAAAKG
jgi:phospholipid/cholesterol/gamma-HCH transport system substrate-binding protein